MELLHTLLSVVNTGHLEFVSLCSVGVGNSDWPASQPDACTCVHLPVSREGTVDLEHLRDAAYGCVADKKLLTVAASELCPATSIAHWSW